MEDQNKEFPPHVLRMKDEFDQLHERCDKLAAFVAGDMFNTLSHDDQGLMTSQLAAMHVYAYLLGQRLTKAIA